MDNILISGGAGFIGSHVCERVVEEFPEANLIILDKMTYAANEANLENVLQGNRRRLVKGDVCDFALCSELTRGLDCIIHLAAESHVDNAFGNSLEFTQSNTMGTHTLLEASRQNDVPLFLHVSTDEVYGEIDQGAFKEDSVLNPSNPYSGSKAGADMIVNSYWHSFETPVIIVRSNNIFGIRQYPEKIVPKFAMQSMTGRKMTLHGDGSNRRHYLAAEDFAEALIVLLHKGVIGEIYNIGSESEFTNIEVARMICAHFERDPEETIEFVADRPFNDSRYSVDVSKITGFGWAPRRPFENTLPDVLNWYQENRARYLTLLDTP